MEYRPDPRFPSLMLHVVNIGDAYYSITHGEPIPCDENAENEELTSYDVDQIANSLCGLQELLKSISQSKNGESTIETRLCNILQEIMEVSISSVHTGHEFCKNFQLSVSASNDPLSSNTASEQVESINEKYLPRILLTSPESQKVDSKGTNSDFASSPLPGSPKAFDEPKVVENKVLNSKIKSSGGTNSDLTKL